MADYPIPPWLAPVSPVAPFLQGVSQGAGIAEAQNRQALAVAQLQEQEQQSAFRAAQAAIQMQMQQEAAQREQALQGQQLFGLRLANQQKAADMAASMQAQGVFQRLVGAGVAPEEAFKHAAGVAPFATGARFYQSQALQQGIAERQRVNTARRLGLPPDATDEQIADRATQQNKTAKIRSAEEAVKSYVTVNPEAKPDEVAALRSRLILDPNAVTASNDVIKEIRAQDLAAQSLGQVLQHINDFESKFGKGSFDKYTGPIEYRLNKFRKNYTGFTDEDEAKANQIFSELAKTVNDYRNKKFGSALTQFEGGEFKKFIDSPESQNFRNSIEAAYGSIGDDVIRNLENYKDAPNIQPAIRARYEGRKPGEWFKVGVASGSGSVQMVNPKGQTVIVPADKVQKAREAGYK